MPSPLPDYTEHFAASIRAMPKRDDASDPLLTDLARLLADPRIPDTYVESVRACIREHCYQLRLVLKEQAA